MSLRRSVTDPPPELGPSAGGEGRGGRGGRTLISVALLAVIATSCSSGGGRDPDQAAFCDLVVQLRGSTSLDAIQLDDPDRTRAVLDELESALKSVRQVAPDEVLSDLDVVAAGYDLLVTTLDDHDGDVVATERALREDFLGDDAKISAFTKASNELTAATDRICGPPPTTTIPSDDE